MSDVTQVDVIVEPDIVSVDVTVGGGGGGAVSSVNAKTGTVILTTSDLSEDADNNYVSDAQLVVIGNTTGTNTGNDYSTSISNGYVNVDDMAGADDDAKLVAADATGRGIMLPTGNLLLNQPFNPGGTNTILKGRSGGTIQGHGYSEYTSVTSANVGPVSNLKWIKAAVENTGIHTGASSTTELTDSEKTWTDDELIGYTIENQTDGSFAEIVSNTLNTVTVAVLQAPYNPAAGKTFENGDSYVINFPVIDYRSSETTYGCFNINGNSVASQGILLQKLITGLGVGKLHLHDVGIHDCDIAIQSGLTGAGNCDVSLFENIVSFDCPTFFSSRNWMSIEHTFTKIKAHGCSVVFDIFRGGNFRISETSGVNLSGPTTLIRLSDAYGASTNTNSIYVQGMKIDNQSDDYCLLDMSDVGGGGTYRSYFRNIYFGYDHYGPDPSYHPAGIKNVILKGRGAYCRLENVHNLQNGVLQFIDTGNPAPTFEIDHCVLQTTNGLISDLFILADCTGDCNIKAYNNIDFAGNAIPDFYGAINADGTVTETNRIESDGTILNHIKLTQAEYDALTPVATTVYWIVG